MVLIHVDVLRKEGGREHHVFAGETSRTAQRHPSDVAAHVARYHIFIVVEAAGADDDAALGHVVDRTVFTDRLDAFATEHVVVNQFHGLGVEHEIDACFFCFLHHVLEKLCTARLHFAADFMTTTEHRSNLQIDGLPDHVAAVGKPLHDAGGFFAEDARKNWVGTVERNSHHVLVEGLNRIGDAVALLHPGVGGVEVAACKDGVAERYRLLFQHGNAGALVCRLNGAGQACTTAADHDHVVRFGSDAVGHFLRCRMNGVCAHGAGRQSEEALRDELSAIHGVFSFFGIR